MLGISLIFYACGSYSTFLILCISIGVNLFVGWFIDINRGRKGLSAGPLSRYIHMEREKYEYLIEKDGEAKFTLGE